MYLLLSLVLQCKSLLGINFTLRAEKFKKVRVMLFHDYSITLLFLFVLIVHQSILYSFSLSRTALNLLCILRLRFTVISVSDHAVLSQKATPPSPHGTTGYAECLCYFYICVNTSTAVSWFEPFVGIYPTDFPDIRYYEELLFREVFVHSVFKFQGIAFQYSSPKDKGTNSRIFAPVLLSLVFVVMMG